MPPATTMPLARGRPRPRCRTAVPRCWRSRNRSAAAVAATTSVPMRIPRLPAIAAKDRRRPMKEAEDEEQAHHQPKPVGSRLNLG